MVMVDILSTIGMCLMLMPLVMWMRPRLLFLAALAWMVLSELAVLTVIDANGGQRGGFSAALLTGGPWALFGEKYFFAYPVLTWFPVMAIGFACGTWWQRSREHRYSVPFYLLVVAFLAFAATFCIRMAGSYGNMRLQVQDGSALSLLYLSKYPPSLAFHLYGLGMAALIGAFVLRRELNFDILPCRPLQIWGRAGLCFYITHFVVLWALSSGIEKVWGAELKSGVWLGLLVAAVIAILLLPVCGYWARLKSRHPGTFLRFL